MRIRKYTALLAALLLVCFLSACGTKPPDVPAAPENGKLIVVGFSQVGAESDWRNANTLSMQTAFSAENGYRLIFDDAQQKQERQITAIRNFINQSVDYIVLAPTTERGWDTVLTEAKAAGIPVIIVDRMIETENPDLFTCWIGSGIAKGTEQFGAHFVVRPSLVAAASDGPENVAAVESAVCLDSALAVQIRDRVLVCKLRVAEHVQRLWIEIDRHFGFSFSSCLSSVSCPVYMGEAAKLYAGSLHLGD